MCLYGDNITSGYAVLICSDALAASVMKCVPSHFVAEQLPYLVLSIILGFRALTECNTMLPLSGKGRNTCCNMFIKYANLLTGIVRNDNFDDAWAFLCSLYGIGEKGVRSICDARHSLFVKAKRNLDVLSPTHGALELFITRANIQAKILLQADHVSMDLENKLIETFDLWQEGTD